MKLLVLIFSVFSIGLFAQEKPLTITEAIDYALQNNSHIRASEFQVLSQRQLKKTALNLPKTDVRFMYGQYNSYAKKDNNLTISQVIPFTAFGSQNAVNQSLVAAAELQKTSSVNDLVLQVKQVYFQLAYAYANEKLLQQQDSLFEGFFRSSSSRYKAGETNLLEQATAEVQRNDARNKLRQNQSDIIVLRSQLKTLLNANVLPEIVKSELTEIPFSGSLDSAVVLSNPSLAYSRQQMEVAKNEKKLESAKLAPDLLVGFFNQTLIGTLNPETGSLSGKRDRFTGVELGLAIPLWIAPHQGRVKAAAYNYESAKSNYNYHLSGIQAQWQQALQQYEKNKNSLVYYRDSALPNASLILKQSQAAFRGGEIGYTEYLLGLKNAISIREGYLATLNDYNQSIIFLEYLSGNK